MRSSIRKATGALAWALAFAALPAAASAGTVTQSGTTLIYTAASGQSNEVRLISQGTAVADLVEQSRIAVTSKTPACGPIPNDGSSGSQDRGVRCRLTGISRLEVRTGDRNDSYGSLHPFPAIFDGGSGDDSYVGFSPKFGQGFGSPIGSSQVDFRGGSGSDDVSYLSQEGVIVTKDEQPFDGRVIGNGVFDRDNIRSDVEVLLGSANNDALTGGAGAETFPDGFGSDTINGGGGNDVITMGNFKNGADTVIGGPGRDKVSYAARDRRVHVSPDTDTSFDGEADEGDRIAETEIIEGGKSVDTLVALPRTSLGYHLIGGPEDDQLFGGDGEDRLTGGSGIDEMRSGGRADLVESRDGNQRELVDCGTNGGDTVIMDTIDRVSACEAEIRPNQPGDIIGVLAVTPRALKAAGNRAASLRVRWSHPVSWRHLRSVQLALRSGKRALGRLTLLPAKRRAKVSGRGLALAPGSSLARKGTAVSARVLVRLPASRRSARAYIDVVATDTRGRRQVKRGAARIR